MSVPPSHGPLGQAGNESDDREAPRVPNVRPCLLWLVPPAFQGPRPALLQEHPVVGQAGFVTHGRKLDL